MVVVGALLVVGGYLACLIYSIWFLVVAFRTSTGWGLACLFVPFVAIVFAAMHWAETKPPVVGSLAAWTVCCLGAVLLAAVGY
jgi:hypothetical protein